MTRRLANAIAEDPGGTLVADFNPVTALAADRRLQEKVRRLEPGQLLAVERIVDQLLEANGEREGAQHP